MSKEYVSALKSEKQHLARVLRYPEAVFTAQEDAAMEGFAYFGSEECAQKHPECRATVSGKYKETPKRDLPKMVGIMVRNIRTLLKGRNECFTDVSMYVDELESNGYIDGETDSVKIDQSLWEALTTYAWEKWRVKMGFTTLPRQLIFKGKAVLFHYALVCIQEMEKEAIMTAPEMTAGGEVMRVYATLGLAVNDIAKWLRQRGVKCQSNHPLGGLVDSSPLAAKAGLGWQGRNGLLITPEYGQRQRIAPIFVQNQIFEFTDHREHDWIERFCETCGRCAKACPPKAIYDEKQIRIDDIESIGQVRTCIDKHKCFPQFNRTMGCSICIKVCPFSQGEGSYERIRKVVEKKENYTISK